MMGKNLFRKPLLAIALAGFLLTIALYIGSSIVIGRQVRAQCEYATLTYPGDCGQALSALLQDESASYRARNSAIWALGQLGDARALPVLLSIFSGYIPPRESLDSTLSQLELKKSIHLAQGGANISAWVWRDVMGF